MSLESDDKFNEISLESDDKFNEFMLFLLVADQIHDFTDKKRLKDPKLVHHLDEINKNIQSAGNSSFKNLSSRQAYKKTRKRSRSTGGKNHIDTRVNKYTRKHSKKHSKKHSRKHSPLTGAITRKRYRSTSGGADNDKRSRESSVGESVDIHQKHQKLDKDNNKPLNSLSPLSASSVGTTEDDVNTLGTLMDDEDDDTTTLDTLMDDDTDTEDSDNVAALITSTLATLLPLAAAEKPANNRIQNFCDKINDINTQLKTNEDYYDGDITMYLLQLLGSFEDEEIRDKYNESDNNFFKFFIPKIKGGAPKNKQNVELNDIKKKIEQLKDISFKDKNDFIKKLNLDNNYKKMIERNPSNNELYRKNIEEYKTNLGTKKEKINELKLQISDFDKKYNKELSYQNLFKIKHLNKHDKLETTEILYNIMDLNELIDKFIEVLDNEIGLDVNIYLDTEIILNRVGIMSLNNLKINYNKYEDDKTPTLDVDQKEAVDKIGELIKGVADVINPITATSATSGISNYKKLYDICKQGTNIENKIKNLVEPIYKNKEFKHPSSIDNTDKAIIINNGSHNFKKLIDHCIYTSACNIDAGSRECPIRETQGMKLKIESPNKENYIDILLDESGNPSVTVKIKLKQLNNTEYTDTYQTDKDNKEITLQKVYINVLKLFLERIETNNFTWPLLSKNEDEEFIGNFIARYSIKTLGDFLQEVNAGIKGGGYIKKPKYVGDGKFQAIKITDKRQDIDRIYMVNDKLSYCRFLAMRSLFPQEKINEKAYAILDTTSTTIQTINNIISNYGIKKIMHT